MMLAATTLQVLTDELGIGVIRPQRGLKATLLPMYIQLDTFPQVDASIKKPTPAPDTIYHSQFNSQVCPVVTELFNQDIIICRLLCRTLQ